MPTTAPVARPRSGLRVLLLVGLVCVMPLALVAAFFVARGTGLINVAEFDGRSDVGALDALASFQVALRPLDACEIRYNVRNRYVRPEVARGFVQVTSCSGARLYAPGWIAVPPEFQNADVSFRAERWGQSLRWRVLVDRGSVAFPALVATLANLTPLIARDAPSAIARAEAAASGASAELERDRQRRDLERARSSTSYHAR